MSRRFALQPILRTLGLLSVIGVLVTAYTPLPNVFARLLSVSSQAQNADAIVVLGAGIHRDGTLGKNSLRRAVQGIVLYRQGLAPLIVFSGTSYEGSPVESEVRASLARQLGVPQEAILLESHADTTAEEAENITAQLRQRGVKRILLITNSLHLRRAVPRFEKFGLKVFPVAVNDPPISTDGPDGRLALMVYTVREVLAQWLYRVGE